MIRTLDESGDAGRLADSYDARTLERLAAAGSGGDKGDDVLSKADEAAEAGKSEDVARLADEVNVRTLRYILETDSVSAATRLLEDGLSGARLEKLTGKVRKLNGNQGGEGYLLQFLKSGERFELDDLDFAARAPTGDEVYLIDTNKWEASTSFERGVHDFRHIVARHVPDDASGSWPINPGKYADEGTSMYPARMDSEDVKDVIQKTIKNAEPDDVTKEGFNARIDYSGQALPDDVDQMRVVYQEETGRIVTAFPPQG